jgi:tRNA-splicing endonuclease subunit Sen34
MANDLIKLTFISGKALTFSPTDYNEIRSNHHIVGKLIGIPVCYQRNMMWNSMPVAFTNYETKLMVEQGIVTIQDKGGLKKVPSKAVKKDFEDHQEKVIAELQKPYVESRLEAIRTNMDNIIRGKRKKLIKTGMKESGKFCAILEWIY